MTSDELRSLESGDPVVVWRTLVDLTDPYDFPVALDYALEHELLTADFAAQLRGETAVGPAKYWINPIDGLEMVWIPGGKFLAGEPLRMLDGRGFFLARYPVTNAQFARFVDETGYEPPTEHPLQELYLQHWRDGHPPAKQEQFPVVWVSFVDSWHYCRWARLTLPNEWHWEKAARGTDGRPFPWGEASPRGSPHLKIEPLAQVRASKPCAVGSFSHARSPYGCEDLVGNVSEWCQFSEPNAEGFIPQTCPEMDVQTLDYLGSHVAVRGSAFLRKGWTRMGAAHRRRLAIGRRNQWVGFRPAFYPLASRVR